MFRPLTCAACLLAGAGVLAQSAPPAQQPPPQQPPVFRSGIDVIRLDVSVLDRERRPINGLTAAEFTVLENGKPQRIVAVTEMRGTEQDPTPSARMRHVAPDVAANDLTDMAGDGRFIALIMDDWNVPWDDHDIIFNARAAGRYVIDQLGPSDVAAVIFSQESGKTQDFTADRQKLIAAIDKFEPPEVRWIPPRPMGPGPGGGDMPQRFAPVLMRSTCQRSQPTVPTLDTVIARLAAVPNRRKTVILVSPGLPITFAPSRGCAGELADLMQQAFRRAQRANVNVYGIDPAGFDGYSRYLQNPIRKGGRPAPRVYSQGEAERAARIRREFLQITADYTGGRAIVNTDTLGPEIDRVMTEAASYYLVGYQTSNGAPDGKFRRLEVRVNRPGATARTRSGFFAPSGDGMRDKAKDDAADANELGLTGMSSVMGLALRAQTLALGRAAGAGRDVDVAVVLGVRLGASRITAPETLTLVRTVYDAQGNAGTPNQEHVRLTVQPGTADELRYEVYQRFTLAPGRWQVRLNATSAALDTGGTVYTDLEVPDFSRPALSISGIVLGRHPSESTPRTDALAGLVPVVPTSAREFSPADEITAFLRVFQGGLPPVGPAKPVTIDAQVLNISDETVWEASATIAADAFNASRGAPFEVALPLAKFTRGPHLLSISATLPDGTKTRADVVFRVK